MPDEPPSLGEVSRNVRDIKDSLKDLSSRVGGYHESMLELRHQVTENTKDIAAIQTARQVEAERQTANRRMVFTSIAAPIIVTFVLALAAVVLAFYVVVSKGLGP